jgi:hypothetical protein
MVTTDWQKFRELKDNGLVKDVFARKDTLDTLTGVRPCVAMRSRWCVVAPRFAGATPPARQRMPLPLLTQPPPPP